MPIRKKVTVKIDTFVLSERHGRILLSVINIDLRCKLVMCGPFTPLYYRADYLRKVI